MAEDAKKTATKKTATKKSTTKEAAPPQPTVKHADPRVVRAGIKVYATTEDIQGVESSAQGYKGLSPSDIATRFPSTHHGRPGEAIKG